MTPLFRIAFRNIFRNRRRSLMTGSAVAAGAMALLLFGGFVNYIFASLETNNVQRIGHLTVFRKGYFDFGAGNPAAYGIANYEALMKLIADDPVLGRMISVLTPTQSLLGIAGNFSGEADVSKTFLGVGLIPSDRDRMRQWDERHTGNTHPADPRMADNDPTRGLIGVGLARILELCAPLKLADCPSPPARVVAGPGAASLGDDIAELGRQDIAAAPSGSSAMPEIDLLAATSGGAPNIVRLTVSGADAQPVKELDDNFVAMPLELAQRLAYGRDEPKATGIVLQLKHSAEMGAARARLGELARANGLDTEVRDFAELTPFYGQVVRLFSSIFLFIALVMGVIVLFAVVNTMTMNVMERTNEIGTLRAMGVRRRGVRWQFLAEGSLIGAIGAGLGVALALVISTIVNHSGLTWTPPGNAAAIPLLLDVVGRAALILGAWLGLVLVATVAALIPASRAARLSVVDALRHV